MNQVCRVYFNKLKRDVFNIDVSELIKAHDKGTTPLQFKNLLRSKLRISINRYEFHYFKESNQKNHDDKPLKIEDTASITTHLADPLFYVYLEKKREEKMKASKEELNQLE